ncbi:MAG TPA: molybdopterin cofactor-binding domain-containing protein [Devosiaceae bacterium]
MTLPPELAANPRLDQWVSFLPDGRIRIATGKVELGQGILTAMAQIAADELDIGLDRIALQSGDTDTTPNEGYTAGSQSIQYGGAALRLACADVRLLFLAAAAARLGCAMTELAVRDGMILLRGEASGHDYWTLAPEVDLARNATGQARPKDRDSHMIVGRKVGQVDLAAKLFGGAIFIEDVRLAGMLHARVLRQPSRGATITTLDEALLRRVSKFPIDIVRHGNFVAVLSKDEFTVEKACGRAAEAVRWNAVEPRSASQAEARWLLQQPAVDTASGDEPVGGAGLNFEATYSRGYLSHGSIAPSCGLAVYRDGHLDVWTHSQGVFPLREALARTLGLAPDAISVRHMQGAGCYGHNGADDAAADAAVIAMQRPGNPIRVQWRREDEFAFEPVGPAMVVSIHARLNDNGQPVDWTTEIWSTTHSCRPGSGANMLAAEAFPDPPAARTNEDVAAAGVGGATRNGIPLYDFAAKRVTCHLVPESPVRTSSLRGLGAVPNLFAIECCVDELAALAGIDPVAYRLAMLSDPRARRVIERVAVLAGWQADAEPGIGVGRGIAFSRYKNLAAYTAIVAEVEVVESVVLKRAWCVTDAGLIVNPDGAINQLEGGIIQAASWALKEEVQIDAGGISSRDWESYPILRLDETPDVVVELVNTDGPDPSLGVGEAAAGATTAAIGNAVAHALGMRIRDLPLTRDRIMAAMMQG